MTQYATVTDLGRFGLPGSATSDLADADLDAQLSAASAEVDSVLDSRGYATPLASWGDDVTSCVARIAAWSVLTNLRGVNPADPGHAGVLISAKDARTWLDRVARGHANPTGLTVARTRVGVMQAFADLSESGEPTRGW